jgi:hypothetical protein
MVDPGETEVLERPRPLCIDELQDLFGRRL